MNWIKSLLAVSVVASMAMSGMAQAADDFEHPKQSDWAFDGMTGSVDRQAAQRGFQVYKEVCSACHGLKRVAFRNLSTLGFSDGEVKTIAAEYSVQDGPDGEGEMFDRAGLPSDKMVGPFANDNAARAANNGAMPPDLSLIIKARHDGGNYVHSLLNGYGEAPADIELGDGMSYNPYFPGKQIAMAAPLYDDAVTYQDGTEASIDQMARDVTVFLQWAAEPEMEQRKRMGIHVLLFLGIMTVLFAIAKKRVWAKLDH